MDGSTGSRPDCNAHPATYEEAEVICDEAGYRLCTADEMLSGITEGKGCWYDAIYQWVSDPCTVDYASISADASAQHSGTMVTEGDGTDAHGSFDDFILVMVGAAIGVMVVAGIVAFVVLMKRKRSGKKEETEMAKMAHVPEVSPASVDGVETI